MTNSRVTGVRSIELGVRDLHQSAEFYTKVWALEQVCSEGDGMHFRATGGEHHVLTIRERPKPALLGPNWRGPRPALLGPGWRGASSAGRGRPAWPESFGPA